MLLNKKWYDNSTVNVCFQGDGTTEILRTCICSLTTCAVVSCFHTYGMLGGSAQALVRTSFRTT